MKHLKVVVVDNFDSFTYNLVQYLGELGAEVTVKRSTATFDEIIALQPDRIVISPGPGHPRDSRLSLELIQNAGVPILGVCLGHQAIAEAFGGRVRRAEKPVHGKASSIRHSRRGVFKGLPQPFNAVRYHSLVIDRQDLPDCLEVTAETKDGEIMAVQHRERPIYGVQFHPESILTENGRAIIKNFLEM